MTGLLREFLAAIISVAIAFPLGAGVTAPFNLQEGAYDFVFGAARCR